MQAGLAVEFVVLAGVENVEAAHPKCNGCSQKQDARIERAADGDPGRGRGDAQRESQNQMGPARESLGVGVEQDDGQGHRRKLEREMVELRGREDEDGAGGDDERS